MKKFLMATFIVLLIFSCDLNQSIDLDEANSSTLLNSIEADEKDLQNGNPGIMLTLKDGEIISRGISTIGGSSYFSVSQSGDRYLLTIDLKPSGATPYQSVLFSVYNNQNPTGWNVNISDSPTTNGWGGDRGSREHDCELQVYNNTLSVYTSDAGGTKNIYSESNFMPKTSSSNNVRYLIRNNEITYWKDRQPGNRKKIVDANLFALDGRYDSSTGGYSDNKIYAGFNRVVDSTSRTGSGITRIYVYVKDTAPQKISTGYDGWELTLKHLQYRDGVMSWSKWKANTSFRDYDVFLNGNDPNDWEDKNARHIFVSEVWKPAPSEIENIVFLVAGQQGVQIDSQDPSNIVTGQRENWHRYENSALSWKRVKDKTVGIDVASVAGQIIADAENNNSKYYGMDHTNTYMVLVFDACFYIDLPESDKKQRVWDFAEWLLIPVMNNVFGKLDRIYLGGSSRGAAFVTRMASEMRHNLAFRYSLLDTKIIVSSFDSVAKQGHELWTNTSTIANPMNPGGSPPKNYCYQSTLTDSWIDKSDVHILQISGGDSVIQGFNMYPYWFENLGNNMLFRWTTYDHKQIGREWHNETTLRQLNWLNLNNLREYY